MALFQSPKTVTDGLVFAFDQNNIKSYKGPALQNLANSINIIGLGGAAGYLSTASTEVVDIPGLGPTTAYINTIQNNYLSFSPNSNNCCPSLHGWGGFVVSPSTLYTYAIVYKVDSGYTNPNYMYRYEYTASSGSYVTEGGVHSDANRVHLGGGWYYAWGTFTTQPTTNWIMHCGLFYYRYSQSSDRVMIAKSMVVQGNYSGLHPKYWPDQASTRSNTQTVLDMVGGNTITANSLTYGADGTFSFNGSNYLSIPSVNLGNGNTPWTVSCWIKTTTAVTDLGAGPVLANSNSSGGPVNSMMGVNNGKIVYWINTNGTWYKKLGVGTTVNDNNWHMLTWVNYTNSTMDMYVDGVLDSNVTNSAAFNNNIVDRIGGSWNQHFVGSIALFSRYDRALSSSEVSQNFHAMRGRFGL